MRLFSSIAFSELIVSLVTNAERRNNEGAMADKPVSNFGHLIDANSNKCWKMVAMYCLFGNGRQPADALNVLSVKLIYIIFKQKVVTVEININVIKNLFYD